MGTFFIVFATWLIVPIFLLGASIERFLRLKKLHSLKHAPMHPQPPAERCANGEV